MELHVEMNSPMHLKYSLLEKAVYELGYELNSRPLWAVIPLKGITNIINH